MALLLRPVLLLVFFLISFTNLVFAQPRALLIHSEPLSDNIDKADRDALGLPSDDNWRTVSDNALSTRPSSSQSLSSSSCEAPYGFLPCTDTILGNLFLLLAYGYLLLTAAKLLSEGSELLLTVLDAGIIGGLLLPILGALPDSILILVSGIGGTKEEAQEEVLVGIGLLAGSIVMLLTVLWGSCLLLGRCDLEPVDERLTAVDKTLTRPYDIWRTGVENDELTTLSARIMILSIIPYIVAQLPMMFNFTSSGNIPVLIACILSIGGLVGYCVYQVVTPWIQQRRKEFAQKMVLKARILDHLVKHEDRKSLIDERGNLNRDYANMLFNRIDVNNDGAVEKKEVALMLTTTLARDNIDAKMVDHFMEDYDVDQNDQISLHEFLNGTEKWCKELKLRSHSEIAEQRRKTQDYLNDLERLEEEEDEESDNPPTKSQIIRRAILLLIVGTILAAIFADPLVDAVNDFSSATNIPSFFISFVLLPLASNSSEAVSSILFAARKKKRNMSLTYSQIYGGVTMNNTMGMGIFLAVIYFRGLVWDFSSEVVVVCLVVIVMGLLASFRRVFPTWMAAIALLLYPISLGLVAVLDYVLGWE